ncbi:hypothetical protein [Paracidovorax citrulli]|uniref:hypothetical protein n=1 Tax=Paracidovorax citrulli TaxID=80869 RepID=UPI003FA7782D
MNDENPTGKYTTLAVMQGELTAITVKEACAGQDLLFYVPSGAMSIGAVSALRVAYPTNEIWEKGSRPGVVIHAVQTKQHFDALQANARSNE